MLSAQSKRYVLSHMCGCASQPMPTYLSSDWFIPFDLKWARQGELSTTASMDTQETVCSVTYPSLCTPHDNRLAAVTPTTTCGQLPAVRPPRHQPLAGHILSMQCDAATHNIWCVSQSAQQRTRCVLHTAAAALTHRQLPHLAGQHELSGRLSNLQACRSLGATGVKHHATAQPVHILHMQRAWQCDGMHTLWCELINVQKASGK